ncbi:hypothetical protein BC628DRAFT_1409635 [Trametes gibbosa]|nr:hypothetical protein BC628DRAFT_1409635 [Trametes gibbosa]
MSTPSTPEPIDSSAPVCVPDPRTDFIEQIFQKVEEETERRAREQTELQAQGGSPSPAPLTPQAIPPAAPVPLSVVRDATRDRRRGSISVSRFGQVCLLFASPFLGTPVLPVFRTTLGHCSLCRHTRNTMLERTYACSDGAIISGRARMSPRHGSSMRAADPVVPTTEIVSALPSRTNSIIINAGKTGAFYQAQKYAGSADSFASSHEGHGQADVRDEEQVTQMETIAGRVSIGKAVGGIIARRLSRSRTRSRDILATPSGLIIGVSVEEATTEAEHGEEAEADVPRTPHGTVFVYAQADGPRSRRSTISMPSSAGESMGPPVAVGAGTTQERRLSAAGWVAKAKDLTKMFRRKSMAVLPQHSSP